MVLMNFSVTLYPVWSAAFDTLGSVGILSAVSCANQNLNVDVSGDMPSTCASPYIIATTASTQQDKRWTGAAFGTESIDLAAPGVDIHSTSPLDDVGSLSGTSFAAPQVSGTVALLYSLECTKLGELMKVDPSATALLVKEFILNSVDKISALSTEVKTGGSAQHGKSS